MLMDSTMFRGSFIIVPCLNPIDSLAELGLARRIGGLRGFAIAFLNHHIGNAPKVELVKRGNKTLVIPEGTPESQLGILINKFTRG
ncbi:MAG: hypothetical protein IKZ07_05280 [Akkermansia sp.]|nr:hypothetical protein [Akkermansia sp.]